jgi:hypothetical protein
LATVRIFEAGTGRILETRVTDAFGRYGFILKPGAYNITVNKFGYEYPSHNLRGLSQDGKFKHLYYSGVFKVGNKVETNFNIPIDPKNKSAKIPYGQKIQRIIAIILKPLPVVGLLLTILSIVARPYVVWNYYVLAVYVALFIINKLIIMLAPQPWVNIIDAKTKKPIQGIIVKLYEAYNKDLKKLLETKISDAKGRVDIILPKGNFILETSSQSYEIIKRNIPNGRRGAYHKGQVIKVENLQKNIIFDIFMKRKAG